MVCIFEDIDAIIKRYGEDLLLSVLDGSNMVDRVLNIGTTNYPEHLDKRIVSRPRRFDRVIKISAPNKKIRKEFLAKKLPKGEDVEKWVRMTEGLSFAGMTEAIISVTCLGNKFEDTIKILTDLENGHPSSGDFGTKVPLGFDGPERFEDDEEF
jgi:SpoVK/Ycf46/Vps4 family AAA+-type ATPase